MFSHHFLNNLKNFFFNHIVNSQNLIDLARLIVTIIMKIASNNHIIDLARLVATITTIGSDLNLNRAPVAKGALLLS